MMDVMQQDPTGPGDRISRNIDAMRAQGASEHDVEAYLTQHEGLTPTTPAGPPTNHGSTGTWGEPSTLRGAAATLLNGAAAGLAGKFGAKLAQAGVGFDNQRRQLAGIPTRTPDEAYNQTLTQNRGDVSSFASANPKTAMGLELGGGLLTALMSGGASTAAKAGGFANYAKGIGIGAGIGGGSAALQSDAMDPAQRLRDAVPGMIGGAVAGAVAPPIVKGLVAAGTPVVRGLANAVGRISPSEAIAAAAQKLAASTTPERVSLGLDVAQPRESIGQFSASAAGVDPSLATATSDATRLNPDKAQAKLLQVIARNPKMTPQMAIDQATAAPAGVPLTPVDLFGTPMQKLARTVRTIPSQGSTAITDMIESRDKAELPAVINALESGAGLTRHDAVQTAKQLAETRQSNAQPRFDKAFANSGALPPELYDGMLNLPFFDKAWAQAQRLAELDGVKLPQITKTTTTEVPGAPNPDANKYSDSQWAQILKAAGVHSTSQDVTTQQTVPNLQAAHYVKLGLDDVVNDKLRAPLDRGGISNTMGVKVLKRLNEWTDGLKQFSPDYAAALNEYAGDSRMMEAQQKGTNLLKMHPDEIASGLAGMSDGEKEQFRTAGMGAVRDYLDQIPETGSPSRALSKNAFITARIAPLFSNPTGADQFSNALTNWKGIRASNRFIDGGSNTADKALETLDVGGPDWGQALVTGVTGGGVKGAAKALARSALKTQIGQAAVGVNEGTANALAPFLTAGSGAPGAMSREEMITMLRQIADLHARMQMRPTFQPTIATGIAGTAGQLGGRQP